MSSEHNQTILIVDADADSASTESHILKRNGFSVLIADSAETAFKALEEGPIDLILMDIDLGRDEMTGTEAAEIILGQYDVPIVFFTDQTEKNMVEKVKGITRYGYVLKSAGEFVLIESINMAFELFKTHKILQKEELALRESEALYRNLMENSIDAVYLLSEEGKVLNTNQVACSMLGYSQEELLQRTIDDIDPNYPSGNFISFWNDQPEGSTVLFESVHRKKNGEIIPVEVNGIFFILNGVKYLFGVARDISERKERELELSEKEQNFRMLAENAGVGITIIQNGDLQFVNSEAIRISGFSREEMLACGMTKMIEHIHTDDRNTVVETYEKQIGYLDSVRTENKIFPPTAYRHIRDSGEVVWIEAYTSLVNFNGEPALMVVHNDISERKRTEAKIEHLLAEKELILRESHHRIKNNMDVIKTLIMLQPDSPELTAGIVKSMMMLYDKLYRSEEFNALGAGDFIPPLVKEIMNIFGAILPVRVSVDVENIVLDSKTLSSLGIVINELISNSMKYAFEGKDDPAITIGLSRSDDGGKLVYEDNGSGFSGSEKSDSHGGFGMKLVRMLAEHIGGSLEVETGDGFKSIVRFGIT